MTKTDVATWQFAVTYLIVYILYDDEPLSQVCERPAQLSDSTCIGTFFFQRKEK